jgi:hypothetical protein
VASRECSALAPIHAIVGNPENHAQESVRKSMIVHTPEAEGQRSNR